MTWYLTDWHCPNCGEKAVWDEHGEGDYYQGTTHICRSCGCSFTLPMISIPPYQKGSYRDLEIKRFMKTMTHETKGAQHDLA